MLNVGLLGAGRIGQVHALNIAAHPGSTLAAVSDVNTSAADTLAEKFAATSRSSEDIELLGSQGLLQAEDVLENNVRKCTAAGAVGAKPVFFFLERYMPAYAAEWDAFVTALSDGTGDAALPVTLDDGVEALAIAEAATESHRSGRTVEL